MFENQVDFSKLILYVIWWMDPVICVILKVKFYKLSKHMEKITNWHKINKAVLALNKPF